MSERVGGTADAGGGDVPLALFAAATVGYRGVGVVHVEQLEVHAGEIVGLVGPNGAGKSTLLKALTGDAQTIAGRIELAGTPIAELASRERARFVGVVPQSVTVAFSLPAAEFVEMGRHPHLPRFGRPTEADRRAVERALELTDTAHLAERPVDALSGGELQRLVFAQALACEPSLLLLDEATAHLDLNHRLQMLDLTRELADDGLAVLAVFHDLDLAARYADRIAVVADGLVREPDRPERVITATMLREIFGVRAVVGVDPVTGSVSVVPVLRDEAVSRERKGRVLVVGGAGSAAPLMRRLVLAGWTVLGAALNVGDSDAVLAEALGLEHVSIPPFAPMDDRAARSVAKLADTADAIVVCPVPFGRGNVDNLRIAARAGKPLVLIGAIEGRDFTDGAATRWWREAVSAGAVLVSRVEEAEAALDAVRSAQLTASQ